MPFIIPIGRANLSPFKLSFSHINKSTLRPHSRKHPNKPLIQFRPCVKQEPTESPLRAPPGTHGCPHSAA